jgi:hypothetical protein
MNETAKRTDVWLWLTIPVAVLLEMAAGGGLLIKDYSKPCRLIQLMGARDS